MPQDQRILDLISASSEQKPATVGPIVNELVGERIAALVDQRRDDIRSNFYADSENDNDEDDASTEDQPDTEEAPNGEDA